MSVPWKDTIERRLAALEAFAKRPSVDDYPARARVEDEILREAIDRTGRSWRVVPIDLSANILSVGSPLTLTSGVLDFDETATLGNNARVAVNKNSGATVGTRRRINFIEGANVTLTVADDSGNEEVDVTIAAAGASASWESSGGDWRAVPASVASGDRFVYTAKESDASGQIAHLFNNSTTFTTGLLATWQNNGTAKVAVGYDGRIALCGADGDDRIIEFGNAANANFANPGAPRIKFHYAASATGCYLRLQPHSNNGASTPCIHLRYSFGVGIFNSDDTTAVDLFLVPGGKLSLDGTPGTSAVVGDSYLSKSAETGGTWSAVYDGATFFAHDGTDIKYTVPVAAGSFIVQMAGSPSDDAFVVQTSVPVRIAGVTKDGVLYAKGVTLPIVAKVTGDSPYTIAKGTDFTVLGDTTSGSLTVNLPASPADGDVYIVKKTAAANTLTIGRNGNSIDGAAADISVTTNGEVHRLQYRATGTSWWNV